ncbi:hypothetical protein C8R47DRAFT_336205 [Mycena vitilis]|nr:hypothetical protein C8R47DRAFT_336205 [Mycena vitilis]
MKGTWAMPAMASLSQQTLTSPLHSPPSFLTLPKLGFLRTPLMCTLPDPKQTCGAPVPSREKHRCPVSISLLIPFVPSRKAAWQRTPAKLRTSGRDNVPARRRYAREEACRFPRTLAINPRYSGDGSVGARSKSCVPVRTEGSAARLLRENTYEWTFSAGRADATASPMGDRRRTPDC